MKRVVQKLLLCGAIISCIHITLLNAMHDLSRPESPMTDDDDFKEFVSENGLANGKDPAGLLEQVTSCFATIVAGGAQVVTSYVGDINPYKNPKEQTVVDQLARFSLPMKYGELPVAAAKAGIHHPDLAVDIFNAINSDNLLQDLCTKKRSKGLRALTVQERKQWNVRVETLKQLCSLVLDAKLPSTEIECVYVERIILRIAAQLIKKDSCVVWLLYDEWRLLQRVEEEISVLEEAVSRCRENI